ncbi:MAG: hypothetical protein R2703_06005 [Micropruina glycogenica]
MLLEQSFAAVPVRPIAGWWAPARTIARNNERIEGYLPRLRATR